MKTKTFTNAIIKQFVLAGLAVIALGCVANIYNSYANVRFIHDPIDYAYYFRYVILLSGGFAFGYFFTKKSAKSNQVFTGVTYACLALCLFFLSDFIRALFPSLFTAPYPIGKMLFMGMSLLALGVTLVLAYFWQFRTNRTDTSPSAKIALIVSLVAYQGTLLVQNVYDDAILSGQDQTATLYLIANLLTSPITIIAISYLVLAVVKNRLDRLFYAGLVGVFYSIFILSLGELQIEAYSRTVLISNAIDTVFALIFTCLFLWQVRRMVGKHD